MRESSGRAHASYPRLASRTWAPAWSGMLVHSLVASWLRQTELGSWILLLLTFCMKEFILI